MFWLVMLPLSLPGLSMAGTTIVIVPIIIAYVLLQRKFIQGLTAGAVKG